MRIDFRSRLLDIALEEELGGVAPGDRRQAILDAALHLRRRPQAGPNGRPAVESEDEEETRFGSSRWFLGIGLVASFLIAMTFVVSRYAFRVGEVGEPGASENVESSAPAPEPRIPEEPVRFASLDGQGFHVPVEARLKDVSGRTVLEDGWIYGDGPSSVLYAGLASVRFRGGGSGVVKLGDLPSFYEAVHMVQQLRESERALNEEELSMLFDTKNWKKGLGLVLCLFMGEAMINDRAVQAAEKIGLESVFARFDLNEDGFLQASECVCPCTVSADANDDGKVTRAEFDKAVLSLCGTEAKFVQLVKEKGGIDGFYRFVKSSSEVPQPAPVSVKAVFALYDKNGNGNLEVSERTCHGTKCADLNEDGKVTEEEFRGVVKRFFGSEKQFLSVVRGYGGPEKFQAAAVSGKLSADMSKNTVPVAKTRITLDSVFSCYDKNGNGYLEEAECCCAGTRMADFDKNSQVTRDEFALAVKKLFGSTEKFLTVVKGYGSAEKFYETVAKSAEKPEATPDKKPRKETGKEAKPGVPN